MTHEQIAEEITRIEDRIEALQSSEIPQLRARLRELRKLAKQAQALEDAVRNAGLTTLDMHKDPTD